MSSFPDASILKRAAVLGIGGVAALSLLDRLRAVDLEGKIALITGGSRGLGLALARELGEQGCKLARAAKTAGVQHFLQTSVANCANAPGVQHFESKYIIEQYIDSLDLPRTFLREVFFMENFTQPVMTSGAKKAMDPYWILPTILGLLDRDVRFHMISVADIAW